MKFFKRLPKAGLGTAIVVEKDGVTWVYRRGQRLSRRILGWGEYTIYRVNIGKNKFTIKCTLPTKNNSLEFETIVQVVYSVEDPSRIVLNNITNGDEVLEPLIIQKMFWVSRDALWDADAIPDVEMEIRRSILNINKFSNKGLQIEDAVVRISLNEKSKEIIQGYLDKEKITREVDFYSSLIKEGPVSLLAFQLAKDPNEINKAIEILLQERRAYRETQLQLLQLLSKEDGLEDFLSEQTGKEILKNLISSIEGSDRTEMLLAKAEELEELEAELNSPTTLRVRIPLSSMVTVTEYLQNTVDVLKAISFIYLIFAILYVGEQNIINWLLTIIKKSTDFSSVDDVPSDLIEGAGVNPLRMVSARYGSPASFDLLGLGKVLEIVRDTIKDLVWRGKHEKALAETERERAKLEVEKLKLENEKLVMKVLEQKLDIMIKANSIQASDSEKELIASTLLPQLKTLAQHKVSLLSSGNKEPVKSLSESIEPEDNSENSSSID